MAAAHHQRPPLVHWSATGACKLRTSRGRSLSSKTAPGPLECRRSSQITCKSWLQPVIKDRPWSTGVPPERVNYVQDAAAACHQRPPLVHSSATGARKLRTSRGRGPSSNIAPDPLECHRSAQITYKSWAQHVIKDRPWSTGVPPELVNYAQVVAAAVIKDCPWFTGVPPELANYARILDSGL